MANPKRARDTRSKQEPRHIAIQESQVHPPDTMSRYIPFVIACSTLLVQCSALTTLDYVGQGLCMDQDDKYYDAAILYSTDLMQCDAACVDDVICIGFDHWTINNVCNLRFSDGTVPRTKYSTVSESSTTATGQIAKSSGIDNYVCYRKILPPSPTNSPTTGFPTISPTTSSPSTSPTKNPTLSPTLHPSISPTIAPTTFRDSEVAFCKALDIRECRNTSPRCRWRGSKKGGMCHTRLPLPSPPSLSPTLRPTNSPTTTVDWCSGFVTNKACTNRSSDKCEWDSVERECRPKDECNCGNRLLKADGKWLDNACGAIEQESFCNQSTGGFCHWYQGICFKSA